MGLTPWMVPAMSSKRVPLLLMIVLSAVILLLVVVALLYCICCVSMIVLVYECLGHELEEGALGADILS